MLVITGLLVGLAGVLAAMFEWGPLRRPVPESAAPGAAAVPEATPSATERAARPSATERAANARPALPQAALASEAPDGAGPKERPTARNENRLVLTQMKVQKYVEEAYPAWRRAHPGEECPHHLSELTEYMDDKDANDAWGRPLRLRCNSGSGAGAKGIRVTSWGRDGERSEDDIKFGD